MKKTIFCRKNTGAKTPEYRHPMPPPRPLPELDELSKETNSRQLYDIAKWGLCRIERVTPTRRCEVDGKPALFHRWAEEDKGVLKINAFVKREQADDLVKLYRDESVVPSSCDVTVMRTTFAIVEYPDGSVHRVPVDRVRFTDRSK